MISCSDVYMFRYANTRTHIYILYKYKILRNVIDEDFIKFYTITVVKKKKNVYFRIFNIVQIYIYSAYDMVEIDEILNNT